MLLKNLAIMSILTLVLVACNEPQYIHVGENWEAIHDLNPSEKTFKVSAKVDSRYKLGDALQFTVSSTKAGRLWIVQVDPDDQVSLLFPHDLAPDNQIAANSRLELPGDGDWSIEASEPLGKSVLAFIVTTGDTDLQDVLSAQSTMKKALRLVQESPAWGLDKQVVDIVGANQ